MRKALTVLVSGLLVLLIALPALAAAPVSVTANVFAESITLGSKGVARINKPIVQFKAGTTADFQSLTTFLVAEQGTYFVRLEIVGPDNKLRAYDGLIVEAAGSNWTHNQLTHWTGVSFDVPGVYRFIVKVSSKQIADYPISARN